MNLQFLLGQKSSRDYKFKIFYNDAVNPANNERMTHDMIRADEAK